MGRAWRDARPTKVTYFRGDQGIWQTPMAVFSWFRGAALRQLTGSGVVVFDAVPVTIAAKLWEGFQVRDFAGDGS